MSGRGFSSRSSVFCPAGSAGAAFCRDARVPCGGSRREDGHVDRLDEVLLLHLRASRRRGCPLEFRLLATTRMNGASCSLPMRMRPQPAMESGGRRFAGSGQLYFVKTRLETQGSFRHTVLTPWPPKNLPRPPVRCLRKRHRRLSTLARPRQRAALHPGHAGNAGCLAALCCRARQSSGADVHAGSRQHRGRVGFSAPDQPRPESRGLG